jgi:predicted DsbA family dithiol-disulfide isomerase
VWTHFPLHPETPEDGVTLEELFAGRNVDLQASQARMRGLMVQEGLAYGLRTKTYNSRLAQELGKWADTQPARGDIHAALFRAYFVDGKNIGRIDTLVEVANSVGLAADQAREVLEMRQFQAAVEADWQRSRALGITGVPTFVAHGRGVVGAQPYAVLERLVLGAGGARRHDEKP